MLQAPRMFPNILYVVVSHVLIFRGRAKCTCVIFVPLTRTQKREIYEIIVTGSTEVCHFENLQPRIKFHQNDDMSISVDQAQQYQIHVTDVHKLWMYNHLSRRQSFHGLFHQLWLPLCELKMNSIIARFKHQYHDTDFWWHLPKINPAKMIWRTWTWSIRTSIWQRMLCTIFL